MKIHEYQARELFGQFGIPCPKGILALTPEEAVNAAREIQRKRFGDDGSMSNSRISPKTLRQHCALDEEGEGLMKAAFDSMGLSARSYDRILRVARTTFFSWS